MAPPTQGLSDEFTVLAWDMPGCGRSDDPPERFRTRDYADCLASFIAALNLGRPHVLWLSFGSGLALELYRWHPDLPRSLVLASAYAGWAGSLPPRVAEQRKQRMLQMIESPPDQWAREWIPTLLTSAASAELVDEVTTILADFHPAGQRALLRSGFAEHDLRNLLPQIAVPTLLLYGESDVRSPKNVAEDMHAAIPGSQLVFMPGVGHLGDVEAPDRFTPRSAPSFDRFGDESACLASAQSVAQASRASAPLSTPARRAQGRRRRRPRPRPRQARSRVQRQTPPAATAGIGSVSSARRRLPCRGRVLALLERDGTGRAAATSYAVSDSRVWTWRAARICANWRCSSAVSASPRALAGGQEPGGGVQPARAGARSACLLARGQRSPVWGAAGPRTRRPGQDPSGGRFAEVSGEQGWLVQQARHASDLEPAVVPERTPPLRADRPCHQGEAERQDRPEVERCEALGEQDAPQPPTGCAAPRSVPCRRRRAALSAQLAGGQEDPLAAEMRRAPGSAGKAPSRSPALTPSAGPGRDRRMRVGADHRHGTLAQRPSSGW